MNNRIDDQFSSTQRQAVEEAVRHAEETTACEIIPVVAEASGRYDRGEDMIGLWCGVLAAIAVWTWFPARSVEAGSGAWGAGTGALGLVLLVAGIVGGFLVGAVMASRTAWLRRLAVPRKQQHEEVARRAREVFFDQRVHHTTGRTGLLIYVSLLEHEVTVLADQEILAHPALGTLLQERTRDLLVGRLKTGDVAEALASTIREIAPTLAAALPIRPDDTNEHPDALVLLPSP